MAWLFKPGHPITPVVRRIHGISNGDVADAPVFAEREAEIRTCLGQAVLVAHNAGIDLGVLKRKMPDFAPVDVIDTLKLARWLLPDQPDHRLGSLVQRLQFADRLPPGLKPHRVQGMSLYSHVENKDELLDGIVEAMAAEAEPPPADGIGPPADGIGWPDALRGLARDIRAMILRHPAARPAAGLAARFQALARILCWALLAVSAAGGASGLRARATRKIAATW
jgi:exodeoxyribonuclease X